MNEFRNQFEASLKILLWILELMNKLIYIVNIRHKGDKQIV